jgi:pyrroline-5-carboxylate reductase
MSTVEDEDAPVLARAPKIRRRLLRAILQAVFTAQYTIVAIAACVTVAGTLHYLVTPQIVARFESIAAALKVLR